VGDDQRRTLSNERRKRRADGLLVDGIETGRRLDEDQIRTGRVLIVWIG
jgi:hypothetical protein